MIRRWLPKWKTEGKTKDILERNIEITKNMLVKGIDVSFISEVTGLRIEKINNLS